MNSLNIPVARIQTNNVIRGSESELNVLIESMRTRGQLQEIVLNTRYEIVAGRRRLEAAKRLGWSHIRAYVSPSFDQTIAAILAERDENCPGCRVQLSRAEQLELARRLEEIENPEAAKRKAAGKKADAAGKPVRDKVGEVIGMSGRSLEKAQAIIDAAQEQPDRYADLGELVSTDKQPIDPVYVEFKQRQDIYAAADSDARYQPVADRLTVTHDTERAQEEYERIRDHTSKDQLGNVIPKRLVKVFNDTWASDAAAAISSALNGGISVAFKAVVKHADCEHVSPTISTVFESAVELLKVVHGELAGLAPHSVCQDCGGKGGKCRTCAGEGWLPERSASKVAGKRQRV